MDGAAIAIQQSRPRQDMAAGAERPDIGTLTVDAAQPREEAAVLEEMAVDAAAEDDGAEARGPVDIAPGVQHDAVAGRHRLGVAGEQAPAVELAPRRPVRQAQRLHRRGEGDHREIGDQHEGDALRQFGGSGSEHGYCFWKVMSGERSRLRQTMPSPFPVSPITTMMEIMESTVSA